MKENDSDKGNAAVRLASMIGLCRRANRLGCGAAAVTDAIKTGRARLVLLSMDASERTKKQIRDKCAYRSVPLCPLPFPGKWLGAACGMAELSACAVLDPEFARALQALAGRL